MDRQYRGSGKLKHKVAAITGGDSGIGRAVALFFAKEGADIAVLYLNEHKDAQETKRLVEQEGRRCMILAGDVGDERFCRESVERIVRDFGRLDVLVNNAAEQHPQETIEKITADQLERIIAENGHPLKELMDKARIDEDDVMTSACASHGLSEWIKSSTRFSKAAAAFLSFPNRPGQTQGVLLRNGHSDFSNRHSRATP